MFKKILVPTDFSSCSMQALRQAVSIAQKFSSEIFILHVLDKKIIEYSCRFELIEERKAKEKIWLKIRKDLAEFTKGVEFGEVRCQKEFVCGTPFEEIVKKAREIKAELIIIGSDGEAADLNGLFFGSTAEKVVRMLPCPVFCLPPEGVSAN
jgi:nucleotide-binding universal stress UspA family protein